MTGCEKVKEWRKKNPEKRKEQWRRDYQRNKERLLKWAKDKYAKDPVYRAKKKAQIRATYFKKKYGITPEERDKMAELTGNRCYVCGKLCTQRGLCIDHDHATGKVRGLLCRQCNSTIGQVDDNIDILKILITYIETNALKEQLNSVEA